MVCRQLAGRQAVEVKFMWGKQWAFQGAGAGSHGLLRRRVRGGAASGGWDSKGHILQIILKPTNEDRMEGRDFSVSHVPGSAL